MVIIRMIKFGLCNQLFTYSYGRYLAKKYNQKLYIYAPKVMDHGYNYDNGIGQLNIEVSKRLNWLQLTLLSHGKNIIHFIFMLREKMCNGGERLNVDIEKKYGVKLAEKGILINYDVSHWENYFEERRDNFYIRGYFQFPRYVYELEDELRDLLKFSDLEENRYKDIISLMLSTKSVCIHIRRGDYVYNSRFYVCNENYYVEAVKKLKEIIGEDIHIFIFSDDYQYVKTHRNLFGEEKIYCVSDFMKNISTSLDELRLMGYCKYFIISNSSFSWWGQFISSYANKRVIAPKKWYADNEESLLYEKDWILIDC